MAGDLVHCPPRSLLIGGNERVSERCLTAAVDKMISCSHAARCVLNTDDRPKETNHRGQRSKVRES